MPIPPEQYERFNPNRADIENVEVLRNWWSVPEDAPERTSEMIRFILEQKTMSVPKEMRARVLKKAVAKQFQRLPVQAIIAGGGKAREEALRRLQMPYQQMIKTGQQLFLCFHGFPGHLQELHGQDGQPVFHYLLYSLR